MRLRSLPLLLSLLVAAAGARAANPTSGSVSAGQTTPTTWTGTTVGGANQTFGESGCVEGITCDTYVLTVNGAPTDWAGRLVQIELSWLTAADEYDVYVHKGTLAGPVVTQYTAGLTADEIVTLDPNDPAVGTGIFTVHVVVATGTAADPYNAKATSIAAPPRPAPAVLASGLPPQYQIFTASQAQRAAGFGTQAGEPSIGVNWKTGKIFFQNYLNTYRETVSDQCTNTPSMLWEEVSSPFTNKDSLDPILFTDGSTGRTQVSQLAGTTSLSAYTDDDGATWVASQGGGIASGVDHQTLGGGRFHAPLPSGAVYADAVYYCSQDLGDAACALSIDGGLTFGPAVPIYSAFQCQGLHGHVKVGPDGTVYVPNANCPGVGGGQGVVVSEDNGTTWTVRPIPSSAPGTSDPSVAVDRGGRLYFGYADNDARAVVGLSDDHGKTFSSLVDVGAAAGIHAVEFSTMVAGDSGRAAFMFLGSTTPGNPQAGTYPGVWHLFVATTFDGGASWFTQDLTPNDPVQRGPIWNGGGAVAYRNLLDFMDATVDGQGRFVASFADGCSDAACAQATGIGNGYTAVASIARQVGGRRLFGAYDPPEPAAPGAPQLQVLRNGNLAYLSWSSSTTGGSPITSYSVYRGTQSGGETLLASAGTATKFVDASVDPGATYYYRVAAANSVGASCGTDEVRSDPAGGTCQPGGEIVGTFAPNLQTGAPANPTHDIRQLTVAEPPFADGVGRLVLTMKVATLSSIPPDANWRILWTTPTSPGYYWYVAMNSDSSSHVTYEYGRYGITSAVVTGVGQFTPLGTIDGSYTTDGTITLTVPKASVGNPQPGDLLGQVAGRAYLVTGTAGRQALDVAVGRSYLVMGNAFCAPATTTVIEDDDARIAYSSGWHQIADAAASAGHFHLGMGSGTFATLSFGVPASQYGALTVNYGRSASGGTAALLLDGAQVATLDFGGGSGPARAPAFGSSYRIANLTPGPHTVQLRRLSGSSVNLDNFVLESSYSNANPPTRLGATASGTQAGLLPGAVSTQAVSVPAGAEVLSIALDAGVAVPLQLTVLAPNGSVAGTASGSAGVLTLDVPAAVAGTYTVQAVNASVGPVDLFLAATPTLTR